MKRIIFSLLIMTLMIWTMINCEKVEAVNTSELNNFNFMTEKYYLKDRVKIKISFDTVNQINFFSVTSILVNGHEELSYETGRDNKNVLYETKQKEDGQLWHYELQFDIEYQQVGTIKMIFKYDFELGTPINERNTDVFYLTTGRWIENVSTSNAIATGLIITFIVSLGTFIIINFSKTKIFTDENITKQDDEHE